MSNWFRFYDEALDDPKVQKLPAEDFRSWVNLLCLAARNDGRLPSIDDIAFALRMDNNGAITLVERLTNGGLIDRCNGGPNGWYNAPHGWKKRQYKSDTSTERVKRFRERSATAPVTPPESEAEAEQKEVVEAAPQPARAAAQPLAEGLVVWNEAAKAVGWPTVAKFHPTRQAALRSRLREDGLDGWTAAIAKARASPFLAGQPPPSWFTFDFILKPGNFAKVIEGNYDGTKQLTNVQSTSDLRGQRPDPALDLLYAAREAERASDDGPSHWGTGHSLPAVRAG